MLSLIQELFHLHDTEMGIGDYLMLPQSQDTIPICLQALCRLDVTLTIQVDLHPPV